MSRTSQNDFENQAIKLLGYYSKLNKCTTENNNKRTRADLCCKIRNCVEDVDFLKFLSANTTSSFKWYQQLFLSIIKAATVELEVIGRCDVDGTTACRAFKIVIQHFMGSTSREVCLKTFDVKYVMNFFSRICALPTSAIIEFDVLEPFATVMEMFVEELNRIHYPNFWNFAARIFDSVLDGNQNPTKLVLCAKIMLAIVTKAHSSVFSQCSESLLSTNAKFIMKIVMAATRIAGNKKLLATLLAIASVLIEKLAINLRKFTIQVFLDVVLSLTPSLSLIWEENLVDMDMDRRYYQESLFNFINAYLILCDPGLEFASNSTAFRCIVTAVIDSVNSYVREICRPAKLIYKKKRTMRIDKKAFSLLSRVIVLHEAASLEDTAKKSRTVSFLSNLLQQKLQASYEITEAVFNRWRYRLSTTYKLEILMSLLDSQVTSESDMLHSYALALLAAVEPDTISLLCEDFCCRLWKFSLSVFNLHHLIDVAANIVGLIVQSSANFEALQSGSSDMFKLVAMLLSKFNLDELACVKVFSVKPSTNWQRKSKKDAPKQWTFRSGLLELILAPNNLRSICPEALLHVLSYNPSYKMIDKRNIEMVQWEQSLIHLLPSTAHGKSETVVYEKDIFIIYELMNYFVMVFNDLWNCQSLPSRDVTRLNIWALLQNFCSNIRVKEIQCKHIALIDQYLQLILDDVNVIIANVNNESFNEVYDVLTGINEWTLIPLAVQNSLISLCERFPELNGLTYRFRTENVDLIHLEKWIALRPIDRISSYTSEKLMLMLKESETFREALVYFELIAKSSSRNFKVESLSTLSEKCQLFTSEVDNENDEWNLSMKQNMIADIVLENFAEDDLRTFSSILIHGSSFLKAKRFQPSWMRCNDILSMIMDESVSEEITICILRKLLGIHFQFSIHIHVLAYLITCESERICEVVKCLSPQLEEHVLLFMQPLTVLLKRRGFRTIASNFLPLDVVSKLNDCIEAQDKSGSFYACICNNDVKFKHTYLFDLFLAEDRIVTQAFANERFILGFRNFFCTHAMVIFCILRQLNFCLQPFRYEILVLRAIKFVIGAVDVSSCSAEFGHFVIHNTVSVVSAAIRSYYKYNCGQRLNRFLNEWSFIFEKMVKINESITSSLCFVVFDVFLKDPECKELLLRLPYTSDYVNDRIVYKSFEKDLLEPAQHCIFTEGYWRYQYTSILTDAVKHSDKRLLRQFLSRYPSLSEFVAPVLSAIPTKSSPLLAASNNSRSIEDFVIVSLVEIFANPFETLPICLYESVCNVLASKWLSKSSQNPFVYLKFSRIAPYISDEVPESKEFLKYPLKSLMPDLLKLSGISESVSLLVVAFHVEWFAVSLFPFLFEIIFASEHNSWLIDIAEKMNSILEEAALKSEIKDYYSGVASITLCVHRLKLNLACANVWKNFPINLFNLSIVSLRLGLIRESYFALLCFFNLQSTSVRSSLHATNDQNTTMGIIDSSTDSKFREHYIDVLIKLCDCDSLRAIPLRSDELRKCRLMLAENSMNWQHLAAISNMSMDRFTQSLALFYSGVPLESLDTEVQCLAAIELCEWNAISFQQSQPSASYHQNLYSLLYARYHKEFDLSKYLSTRLRRSCMQKVLEGNFVNDADLNRLQESCVLELLCHDTVCVPKHYSLRCSWSIANLLGVSDRSNEIVPFVIENSRKLCSLKAYEPAFRMLEKFRDRFLEGTFEYFELDIERSRILKICGEAEVARSTLIKVVENNSTNDAAESKLRLMLKAKSLLAEFDFKDGRPDLASLNLSAVLKRVTASSFQIEAEALIKASRNLAYYAESKLLSMEAYQSSNAYKTKEDAVKNWSCVLQERSENKIMCNRDHVTSREQMMEERRIMTEKASEETDIHHFKEDMFNQISTALVSYLNILCVGASGIDDIPYRLLPILIKIKDEEKLIGIIQDKMHRLPVCHWLPLLSQLCSYFFALSPLSHLVRNILTLVINDHPFHIMNHLLPYAVTLKGDNDSYMRKQEIDNFLSGICQKNSDLQMIMSQMRRAFKIYNDFAMIDPKMFQRASSATKQKRRVMACDSLFLNNAEFFRSIPVPAIQQPSSGKLEEMILFAKIDPVLTIADGISQPLIVTITDSTGCERKLIFKKENLRQDSSVEQLFSVVNLLLSDSLNPIPLRTYHVLPVSLTAGIIEFCSNTMSLGDYLCGENRCSGAHKRYYPTDMNVIDARAEMTAAQKKSSAEQVAVFDRISRQIHPVFRHFFYERYFDPWEWYERLYDYTVSLAQWSIVCYAVGLGDRHLSNILIDLRTGRLVHIDLGMVFEYGRRNLPIPERVPFRLTRDIIDPIRVETIDARFKTFAVLAMDRLRENSLALIGIAAVQLHDPLSVYRRNENAAHFSELALCRFKDKLAGIENRVYMDSHQQVTHLMNEATDRENLARMFSGWMPFL